MKQFFTIILAIGILTSCSENIRSSQEQSTKFDQKHEPYDHEVIRLFGPEPSKENVLAYQKSTRLAIEADKTKSDIFNGEWTLQGPGNIGGRVNSLAVDSEDAATIYAGFARGGLWKTTDNAVSWTPLWNNMSPRAISAIELVPGTDIVYVGTGDVNVSGSPYVGDGIYKSEDGGQTWTNLGLETNYIIGDIKVNTTNPDIITVATMGLPFEQNNDRGIYRTEDGGQTWTQTLFIDSKTGVHDLATQASSPDILLAGAWTRFRNGKESTIAGPGSGVYRSSDSGNSWTKVILPVPDTMGRVAVTFSQNTQGLAYAMFITPQSRFHSLHKSTDAGESWTVVAEQDNETPTMMGGFAWFFGRIATIIDPTDGQEKLYLCGVDLWSFNETEMLWEMKTPPWWEYTVHADKHSIMNDADNNIVIGTDGGIYRTDGSGEWSDIENIPTNMFYRVGVNNFEGDQFYGGMQDNGTSGGNENFINDWPRIFGGDGFQIEFDPNNPDVSYVETQNGRIYVNDGYGYYYIDQGEVDGDRRNWDMPYIISPHNSDVLYTGTYRAARITNNAGYYSYEPISESLTDEPEFINSYHTITSLDESVLEEGLLYFGTADGNVWRKEGNDFVSISAGLPKFYISSIKASPDNVDRVYVTLSAFMFNDNTARIFRSDDRGDTWVSIGDDLPTGAVNDVVIYDQLEDSILFVATNIGAYATINAGQTWDRLGENLPYVPVRDMVINPLSNLLVAGTYGNSINTYPVDSVVAAFNEKWLVNTSQELIVDVSLFPNPTVDYLTVKMEIALSLKIYNMTGQAIMESGQAKNHQLDVSSIAPGTYQIQIIDQNSGKSLTRQFVKIAE